MTVFITSSKNFTAHTIQSARYDNMDMYQDGVRVLILPDDAYCKQETCQSIIIKRNLNV